MNSPNNADLCPCGSNLTYADCCEPVITGRQAAQTPEHLMRSRYSAYAKQCYEYILNTYTDDTRPNVTSAVLAEQNQAVKWLKLAVLDASMAGESGEVSFQAYYKERDHAYCLAERSRFSKASGRWLYIDGEMLPETGRLKVKRNDACVCGSGAKAKRCCFR